MKYTGRHRLSPKSRVIQFIDGSSTLYKIPVLRTLKLNPHSTKSLYYTVTTTTERTIKKLAKEFQDDTPARIEQKYSKLIGFLIKNQLIEKCSIRYGQVNKCCWRTTKTYIPLSDIVLQLTHLCNMRCSYCYNKSQNRKRKTMPYDIAKRVISEFSYMGGRLITFTGGEPFLYPYFWELAKYSSSLGLGINIMTNGTLIDEACARKLTNYAINSINIGCDSVMGKNNFLSKEFRKSHNIIEILKNNELPLKVSILLDEYDSRQELCLFIRYLMHHNIPISLTYDFCRLANGPKYIKRIARRIFSVYRYVIKTRVMLNGKFYREKNSSYDIEEFCGVTSSNLFIASDGEAGLCPTMTSSENPSLGFGNVMSDSVYDIWSSKKLKQMQDKIRCRYLITCRYRRLCGGGCRSNALFSSNDFGECDQVMREICRLWQKE